MDIAQIFLAQKSSVPQTLWKSTFHIDIFLISHQCFQIYYTDICSCKIKGAFSLSSDFFGTFVCVCFTVFAADYISNSFMPILTITFR